MTETYNAGEIVIVARLDTSVLKGEFDALARLSKTAGAKSSKSFIGAFEGGQGSKQIQGAIFKGLNAAVEGRKAGKGFSVAFKAEANAIKQSLKGQLGSIFGKAVLSGGVGLAFDAIGLGITAVANASREAKEEQARWLGEVENANTLHAQHLTYLDGIKNSHTEGGEAAVNAAGKVAQLTGQYQTLGTLLKKLANQERNRKIEEAKQVVATKQVAVENAKKSKPVKAPFDKHTLVADQNSYQKANSSYQSNLDKADEELRSAQNILKQFQSLKDEDTQSHKDTSEYYKNLQNQIDLEHDIRIAREGNNSKKLQGLLDDRELLKIEADLRRSKFGDSPEIIEEAKKRLEQIQKARKQPRKTSKPLSTEPDFEPVPTVIAGPEEIDWAAKGAQFKSAFLTPLEQYADRLREIEELQSNKVASDVVGDESRFENARIDALVEYVNQTEDVEAALEKLAELEKLNLISTEEFGQAFQDLTNPIMNAADALEYLQNMSAQGLNAGAVTAANRAIQNSDDYGEDIEKERKDGLRQAAIDLEKKAAQLEKDLILAELSKEEDTVDTLETRLAVIAETINQLNAGVDPAQAEKNAEEFVRKDKEFGEQKKLAELEGDAKELFKGGIKAAFDGDFEEFLSGKLQGAADSMFDNAIDTLLDSLLGEGGPLEGIIGSLFGGGGEDGGIGGILGGLFGGGKSADTDGATDALGGFTDSLLDAEGGLGGFGGALSSIFGGGGGLGSIIGGLFAGFFADGGVVPKGQFAIVGEQGPEIISAGASPLRVTPMNDNYAASHAARLAPDGGGARSMAYAPVNNFYGHTQDDLRRSLDERDRSLKSEMPGMMDRHTFNRKRGMA